MIWKRSRKAPVHNSIAQNPKIYVVRMHVELHFNNKAIIITILSPLTEQTLNAVILPQWKINHL